MEKEICKNCGEKMVYRMIDIDGTNLEEMLVCEFCGDGYPSLYNPILKNKIN